MFSESQMITMPACECSFCKNCFKENFHIVIKEKQVKHFNCPVCRKPDMSNRDIPDAYGMIFVSMVSAKFVFVFVCVISRCLLLMCMCAKLKYFLS